MSVHVLKPWCPAEAMTIAAAAKLIGQSEANMRRLVLRHNLGRRISGPWVVSRVAVLMYIEGNKAALKAYQAGDRTSPEVAEYYRRWSIRLPIDGSPRAALTVGLPT